MGEVALSGNASTTILASAGAVALGHPANPLGITDDADEPLGRRPRRELVDIHAGREENSEDLDPIHGVPDAGDGRLALVGTGKGQGDPRRPMLTDGVGRLVQVTASPWMAVTLRSAAAPHDEGVEGVGRGDDLPTRRECLGVEEPLRARVEVGLVDPSGVHSPAVHPDEAPVAASRGIVTHPRSTSWPVSR